MYSHICIKPGCNNSYEDDDPDRYYCPSCVEEKKKIAAKIDATIGAQPREHQPSDLELFDAQAKILQKPDGSTAAFIRATL